MNKKSNTEKEITVSERPVIVYRNVFKREEVVQTDFNTFIKNPQSIFNSFEIDNFEQELENIKNIQVKDERNNAKRNFIPAVDLSQSGVLSIDIDNISKDELLKTKIIEKLKKLNSVYCLMESVSGNLVVFFKYECYTNQFPFLYYKIYLELTLLLSVNIDFLPEIGRLRYVSLGEVYIFNENSEVLDELLEVETLPYINTQVGKEKARKTVYGSN
jgi:hypothetical protein